MSSVKDMHFSPLSEFLKDLNHTPPSRTRRNIAFARRRTQGEPSITVFSRIRSVRNERPQVVRDGSLSPENDRREDSADAF